MCSGLMDRCCAACCSCGFRSSWVHRVRFCSCRPCNCAENGSNADVWGLGTPWKLGLRKFGWHTMMAHHGTCIASLGFNGVWASCLGHHCQLSRFFYVQYCIHIFFSGPVYSIFCSASACKALCPNSCRAYSKRHSCGSSSTSPQ